jgi:hypothetical protein
MNKKIELTMERLFEVRNRIKDLKIYEKEFKDKLIKSGEIKGKSDRYSFEIKRGFSKRFDSKEFKENNKDLYELYIKEVPTTKVEIKEIKTFSEFV